MILSKYTKDRVGLIESETDASKEVSVSSFISKTDNVDVSVIKDSVDTKVSYSFSDIIPENAKVTKKDLVIYGELNNSKKLITASNKLNELVQIDNKFEKPELHVNIEYELDNKYYVVQDIISVVNSKQVKLNVLIPQTNYTTPESAIEALFSRIEQLEQRIITLESRK